MQKNSWLDPEEVDTGPYPVGALHVTLRRNEKEIPPHEHVTGQLIFALDGAVTCEVPGSLWMVPPGCAVWVPAGARHSCRSTTNAKVCFLFVKAGAAALADGCRSIQISPMVREMILHLADHPCHEPGDAHALRLMRVLLSELERMPQTSFQLPVPAHPQLRQIVDALIRDPAQRRTLAQWAGSLAMSERTLARLVIRETGMSFGRWRRQLHLLVALRQLAGGAQVQQISDMLGYGSATAFITMFKKASGMTPNAYFRGAEPA